MISTVLQNFSRVQDAARKSGLVIYLPADEALVADSISRL